MGSEVQNKVACRAVAKAKEILSSHSPGGPGISDTTEMRHAMARKDRARRDYDIAWENYCLATKRFEEAKKRLEYSLDEVDRIGATKVE